MAVGRLERHGEQARRAVRRHEREVDVALVEAVVRAEPLTHPRRVAGDLQVADRDLGVGARRRVQGRVVPLDEEGQLRVGDQALDAELAPLELDAVGAVPVAVDGLAAEALLDRLRGRRPRRPSRASRRRPRSAARTAWPKGALSEAGWSSTSTTSR